MKNISIVICCYNAEGRIMPTLVHLANQVLQGLSAEVIVVDNNCSDATVSFAKKVWAECRQPFELKIIEEKQPGLSYARRAGVAAAKGEILIFCDDDNWLDEDFCHKAYHIMQEKPEVGVLGGRGEAKTDGELPFWFATYQGSYAVGVQSMYSDYVCKRKYVWGAGMVMRTPEIRQLFESGFVSLLSDRKGTDLSSGGDSEICRWFLLVGKKLFYSEELKFYHYIEPKRLDREYLKKLHIAFAESEKLLSFYNTYLNICNNFAKLSMYHYAKLRLKYSLNKTNNYERTLLEIFNKSNIVFDKKTLSIKQAIKNYKKFS